MDGDEGVERDAGTTPSGTGTDDRSIGVAVVSIATADPDGSTVALVEAVETAGHEIAIRERIEGGFDTVQATVSRLADRDDVEAVFALGGVGIGPDDATVRAVHQLLDAELPAFETLVTTRAAGVVGADALTVRPLAGVIDRVPVFCLPDDVETVELAMADLVCPQLVRVVELASPLGAGDGSNGNA